MCQSAGGLFGTSVDDMFVCVAQVELQVGGAAAPCDAGWPASSHLVRPPVPIL
jgi:hypothetical protein